MKKSLVNIVSKGEKEKLRLKKLIERKTIILEELYEKQELLKMELETISHEYNIRIGALLLKDNQLDLEILQLKNLQELMRGGMTYSAAMKYEEDAFYSETIRMQKEQEKLDEEKRMINEIADVSEEVMEDIKTIWKKLIRKFHPDLITDSREKEKREEIMKKINKAYTERNLEALRAFENTQTVEAIEDLSAGQLEESLEKIENSIRDVEGELHVLQKSTWYEWKKKKEKVKQEGIIKDVFADLEQKFLDDIVRKIEIVQKLRNEVHPHGSI
ncbi:MAG TPA: J domain-containing protein [Patescibacteria group bacterium]|nr:J domain-containing protein [Patescibacteria group bacterium]